MRLDYRMADSPALTEQSEENFQLASAAHSRRVDRIMIALLAIQWPGLVVTALILSAFTWNGGERHINPHLVAALLSGPAFIWPAIFLAWRYPGSASRHVLAVAQMLVSTVLVDITNGRIESHFHIFGSLAIIAFYRDWRVLATASLVTTFDHFVRGYWFPVSVYGVLTVQSLAMDGTYMVGGV